MMNQSISSVFGKETTISPPNWQHEPNTRGTWTIISTCLMTLSLCLWTALHLNVPELNGKRSQRCRKLGWLLIGLLAPEMVVCTAVIQRSSAKRLTRTMQARFGEKSESECRKLKCIHKQKKENPESDSSSIEMNQTQSQPFTRRHAWTHVHSFYFMMGGFAFDTSNAKPNFLPYGRSRLTLRVQALEYLVEHAPHLIPDLSKEEIRDKSKADGLAKLIVCLQAIWFCTQCIIRLAQKQAISLLELNTFGHAVCALLLYFFWRHKPLDIESPTLLEGDEAWEICALMCVTSNGERFWNTVISSYLFRPVFSNHYENRLGNELSRGQKYGDRVIAKWTDIFNGRHLARLRRHRFEPRMILRWDPVPGPPINQMSNAHRAMAGSQNSESDLQSRTPSTEVFRIKRGESLFGFRCMDVYAQADWYRVTNAWRDDIGLHTSRRFQNEKTYRERTILRDTQSRAAVASFERECTLQASDLYRWELVSSAWRKYQPEPSEYDYLASPVGKRALLHNCVCDRMRNWSISSNSGESYYDSDFFIQFLTATLAGSLYGGLHLLAWNAPFASWQEQTLWRVSGILIASSGLILPGFLLMDSDEDLPVYLYSLTRGRSPKVIWKIVLCSAVVSFMMFVTAVVGAVVAYIPARGFLIAESCMQVARLPPGAYEVPQWSRYWPHIG